MKAGIILSVAAAILCLGSDGPAGSDPNSDVPPRVIVDWGRCGLKVVDTEVVDKIKGTGGAEIKPQRRDQQLLVIELEGIAPEDGFTTVLSNSFGLQFVYRGVNTVVQSTAWQLKGKNIDTGEPLESWNSDPVAKTNLGIRANQQVRIGFVCEVPKEAKEFRVLVPSLLEEPVRLGK